MTAKDKANELFEKMNVIHYVKLGGTYEIGSVFQNNDGSLFRLEEYGAIWKCQKLNNDFSLNLDDVICPDGGQTHFKGLHYKDGLSAEKAYISGEIKFLGLDFIKEI